MTFEARLAEAYERYLAFAPVDVDAVTLAAAVVAAPRRRWPLELPARGTGRRVVALGILAMLLLATVAAVLFIVGQLVNRRVVPWVYRNEIVARPDLPEPVRFARFATLLDGRVLILDGESAAQPTALLMDPVDGSARHVGSLPWPVSSLVRMANGQVMLFGARGTDATSAVPVVGLLDPSSMHVRETGPLAVPRLDPAAAELRDGRVVIAGGMAPGDAASFSIAVRSIEIYDPQTQRFRQVAELPVAATAVRSVLALPDGRIAVATEVDRQDGTLPAEQLYVWDPVGGGFEEIRDATLPRYPSFQLLRDGRVLITGDVYGQADGADSTLLFGVSVVWDPAAGTFERTPAAPWRSAAIELNDGRLLVIGSPNSVGGSGRPAVATLDLATGVSSLVPGQRACYPGVTRLLDGRVAFIGGLEDCETHDMATGGHEAPAVPWVQFFQ